MCRDAKKQEVMSEFKLGLEYGVVINIHHYHNYTIIFALTIKIAITPNLQQLMNTNISKIKIRICSKTINSRA